MRIEDVAGAGGRASERGTPRLAGVKAVAGMPAKHPHQAGLRVEAVAGVPARHAQAGLRVEAVAGEGGGVGKPLGQMPQGGLRVHASGSRQAVAACRQACIVCSGSGGQVGLCHLQWQ